MFGFGRVVRVLGERECGECGGIVNLAITSRGDILSICRRCGFVEWEWSLGDSLDYLQYLARMYGIDYRELVEYVEEASSSW